MIAFMAGFDLYGNLDRFAQLIGKCDLFLSYGDNPFDPSGASRKAMRKHGPFG